MHEALARIRKSHVDGSESQSDIRPGSLSLSSRVLSDWSLSDCTCVRPRSGEHSAERGRVKEGLGKGGRRRRSICPLAEGKGRARSRSHGTAGVTVLPSASDETNTSVLGIPR